MRKYYQNAQTERKNSVLITELLVHTRQNYANQNIIGEIALLTDMVKQTIIYVKYCAD